MKKLKARLKEREVSGLSRWTVIGLIVGAVAGAIAGDFSERGIWIILGAVAGLILGAGIGYLSDYRQRKFDSEDKS